MEHENRLNVVELRPHTLQDIPACLRNLADRIEAGDYGDAHNVAWVVDEGDGAISIGLMGGSKEPGAEAHLLFALAQRKIEDL